MIYIYIANVNQNKKVVLVGAYKLVAAAAAALSAAAFASALDIPGSALCRVIDK